jgi:hypothetical protein
VHHQLRHHAEAVTSYHTALELWRAVGDRYNEAGTLTRLGDTYADSGDAEAAHGAWTRALDIFVELGHADADRVRAKLEPNAAAADDAEN